LYHCLQDSQPSQADLQSGLPHQDEYNISIS